MFDEKISRRSFLTGGTKVAAALFVAPAIIKIDHLMRPVMPPERKIVTDANAFNFTIAGLEPGAHVYVADEITGKVYINEQSYTSVKRWNLPEGEGRPIVARVRKAGFLSQQFHTGLPFPEGKTKLAIQMPRDRIYV